MADAAAASMLDQLPVNVSNAVDAARQAVRPQGHFFRVGELAVASQRQASPSKQPLLGHEEPTVRLLDAPQLSQYLRWHAPPSMRFRGFHLLLEYLDHLTRPDAPVVWMTWHEAFLPFQLITGARGFSKSQRRWCFTGPQAPYDFLAECHAWSRLLQADCRLRWPDWRTRQAKPTNPAYIAWTGCVRLHLAPDVAARVRGFMQGFAGLKAIRRAEQFSGVPCAAEETIPRCR